MVLAVDPESSMNTVRVEYVVDKGSLFMAFFIIIFLLFAFLNNNDVMRLVSCFGLLKPQSVSPAVVVVGGRDLPAAVVVGSVLRDHCCWSWQFFSLSFLFFLMFVFLSCDDVIVRQSAAKIYRCC